MFIQERIFLCLFAFFTISLVASSERRPVIFIPAVPTLSVSERMHKEINVLIAFREEERARKATLYDDSRKLKNLLEAKQLSNIQSFLHDDTKRIYPFWSGNTRVTKRGTTIIHAACALENIDIINRILKLSDRDCFLPIIESLIQHNLVNVLTSFIVSNEQRSIQEKFSIAELVLDKRSLWRNTFCHTEESKREIFKNVGMLLFPDGVDEKNKDGETLKDIAIKHSNDLAKKLLDEYEVIQQNKEPQVYHEVSRAYQWY